MTLVAALGRIDDIQQRIRSLSPEPAVTDVAAAAAGTGGTGGTGSATASAFASAVRDVGGTGEVPALPAGPVDGGDIVAQAKEYLGVPYVFGGEDRSGMDCSGLVQRVLADLGIDAPRVVQDQADIGVEVPSLADARPGDLIVTKGEGHIVIYAGDGMVIHAPSPGKYVELRDNWLKDGDIATIRRVVPPPGEGGAAVASLAASGSIGTGLAGSAMAGSALSASVLTAPATTTTAVPAVAAGAARTAPAAVPATASGALTGAALDADATGTAGATVALIAALGAGASASPAGDSADASAGALSTSAAASGLTPVVGSPAPAAAASPTPATPPAAQPPLAPQLTTPLVNLARSGQGEHTLTLRVSPEDLGPVTVKARITGSSVTIELASGTAAGRDALRALLVDLRRDLAVLVPHSSIAITAPDTLRGDQAATGTAGSPGGSTSASTSGQSFGQGSPDGSPRDREARPGTATPVIPLSPDVLPLPAPTAAAATGIDLFA